MKPIAWRALSLMRRPHHHLPRSHTARVLLAAVLAVGAGRAGWATAQAAPPDTIAATLETPPDSLAVPRTTPPDSLAAPPPVRLVFLSDSTSTSEETPPPRRRITFDHEFEWGREHANFFRPWTRYNRVQGFAIYGEVGHNMEPESWLPGYHAGLGYGFAAHRGWYGLGAEQPLLSNGALSMGIDGYRSVLPFFYGDEAVGEGENSMSTLFLHRDYRDWYETEGGRAFIAGVPVENLRLSAGITLQEEGSLRQATDWSVWRQKADFRPNPRIPEGDYRGFDVGAVYDTRPRDEDSNDCYPRTSWGGTEHWYRLTYERGNGGLGGDFDLWRVTADLRTYFRLSTRQTVSTRLLAGSGASRALPPGGDPQVGDRLPANRRYAIGGLGTLRGHNYRELRGNRVALFNFEYAFSIAEEARALLFMDSGTAWDEGSLKDQRVPVDLGVGFSAGDEGISILAARNVNRSNSDVKVSVRFQESF